MGDSIYSRHENNVYTQDEIIWKVGEKKRGFGDVGRVCYRDRRDCQLLPAVVRILIPMEREGVDMKGKRALDRFLAPIRDTNLRILHIHLDDPECQNKYFLQKERNNSIHYQPECVCWILYRKRTCPNANLLSNTLVECFPRFLWSQDEHAAISQTRQESTIWLVVNEQLAPQ